MRSDWEMIDDGSFNGVRKFIRSGDEPDDVQIRYEGWDVQPILDQNKAAQADSFDKRGDMWYAARIPASVMFEWMHKHGVNAWDPAHADGVKRLLNDPEYRYLRVNHFIM
ncbi:hypothetical protein [Sphingobium sp. EP60837]|uniref:hypothetical protein n=1 Tax=Sphingobium sp. EP60837 TaxID=1855519 RepID=UPI0007DDC3C0|nr:hypothetical protein [Sphingobium sp. EP60837]ANI79012.1 hypothetical protein EP837_02617 [Sphingobium sp. EP60837]